MENAQSISLALFDMNFLLSREPGNGSILKSSTYLLASKIQDETHHMYGEITQDVSCLVGTFPHQLLLYFVDNFSDCIRRK